jgi:hypothetical protein
LHLSEIIIGYTKAINEHKNIHCFFEQCGWENTVSFASHRVVSTQ